MTRAIKDAPPVVYFDNNGRSREVPEEKETIVCEFIRMKLSGSKFLDGPWTTAIVRSSIPHRPCIPNSLICPERPECCKFP